MKRIILILLVTLTTISCGSRSNKYMVTEAGDTIASRYVVADRRVGEITRGTTTSRLNKLYGSAYVKELRTPYEIENPDSTYSSRRVYYIYNEDNHLDMIAYTKEDIGGDVVNEVVIKSNLFTTEKGITINSTVDEIRRAYPDAVAIQTGSKFYILVSSLDLYFGVNERYIENYNPEFIDDISIDDIVGSAHPSSVTISWYSYTSGIFSSQFWEDLLSRSIKWLIIELPKLLFIIFLFVVIKRLLTIVFHKINRVAEQRAEGDDSINTSESLKRLGTITGIANWLINIILWCILILIILSRFNINIAPILASAGILGLAVGFGAQELVRDFISGFFILLEDQIRTGDVAIINETTGIVEKIELRTVTLRDFSGVVHIFQNGKINSLSNMTKEWSAIVLEIGVAYKEDIDRVIEVMESVGAELKASEKFGPLILEDVNIWGLDAFADSSIVIKMSIKTRPMKQWRIKREYLRMLKLRFDSEGIEIPFPHLSIYSGEATKPMPVELINEIRK